MKLKALYRKGFLRVSALKSFPLFSFALGFTTTLAFINRYQFSLFGIEYLLLINLPFVKASQAQGIAFVLFGGFLFLERKDIGH